MNSQAVRSIRAALAEEAPAPHWLWTWNGVCFGFRQGNSLFTCGGAEAGRFAGSEIYGADGKYLGEVRTGEDGDRLVASSYKKSCTSAPFVPTFERVPGERPASRAGQPLYCGYEDFSMPETAAHLGRKQRARRHPHDGQRR